MIEKQIRMMKRKAEEKENQRPSVGSQTRPKMTDISNPESANKFRGDG